MQVHLLHRHLVDGRLDLGEPLKERLRPIAAGCGERRAVNQRKDFGKATMAVPWIVGVPLNSSARNVPVEMSPASRMRSGLALRMIVAISAIPPIPSLGRSWPWISFVCMITM